VSLWRSRLGCCQAPVDRLLAFELVTSELWALHPIVDSKGPGAAKREQVRLAGGRPLAICRQTPTGREVKTRLGTSTVHGEGCLHIFEAPVRTNGGHMFPHQCPDCRPRNGKRNPPRDAERKLRARAAEIAEMRSGVRRGASSF
jgi:hypothetical protein